MLCCFNNTRHVHFTAVPACSPGSCHKRPSITSEVVVARKYEKFPSKAVLKGVLDACNGQQHQHAHQVIVTEDLPVAFEVVGAAGDVLHALQPDASCCHGLPTGAQPICQ